MKEHKLSKYHSDVLSYLTDIYGSTNSIEARNVNKENLAMAGVMLDLLEATQENLAVNKEILESLKSAKVEDKPKVATKATK